MTRVPEAESSPSRWRIRSRAGALVTIAIAAVLLLAGPLASTIASEIARLETRQGELREIVGQGEFDIEQLEWERSELLVELDTLNAALGGSSDAAAVIEGPTDGPSLLAARDAVGRRLDEIDHALRRSRFDVDLGGAELEAVDLDLAWLRAADGRSVITGRPNPLGNDRSALVVKIDNVVAARPQSGINDADLVFVELVEYGVTRFAAVFHSEEVPVVGPVRSMRTTDVELLQMLRQPLFANSGGNARTTRIINDSPLVNIGAATDAGGAYYRSSSRRAPHNLYSSTAALRQQGGDRGGVPVELFTIRRPGTPLPNVSRTTTGVSVEYPNTSVSYTWNGSGWARIQDGRLFSDAAGVRVAPETVIIQFTRYGVSPADANSPEAIATGEGEAWILTEGRVIEGTWSKPKARNVTVYRDADGRRIELLPGRVWVELPRPGDASILG